jgi:hypothetical protein
MNGGLMGELAGWIKLELLDQAKQAAQLLSTTASCY